MNMFWKLLIGATVGTTVGVVAKEITKEPVRKKRTAEETWQSRKDLVGANAGLFRFAEQMKEFIDLERARDYMTGEDGDVVRQALAEAFVTSSSDPSSDALLRRREALLKRLTNKYGDLVPRKEA